MPIGALTDYVDVPQIVLYAFFAFFAGLVFYLRREDKREGYPLESDRSPYVTVEGFPPMPAPKSFLTEHGVRTVPRAERTDPLQAVPTAPWPGAPLQPTGDPMRDGVGPAAYAARDDLPDLSTDGTPRIVPLRAAPGFFVDMQDPDPRGMTVIGMDGAVAGTVSDVWVDRSEVLVRYLEVAVAGGGSVLLPMPLARVSRRLRQVNVKSIRADQFAAVPALRHPDMVTLLEEDRISAYYGGGYLYANPLRAESLL